jgi:hypothetical protein
MKFGKPDLMVPSREMFSCLAYITVSVIFGLLETNNENDKRELDIKKKKKTCRIENAIVSRHIK